MFKSATDRQIAETITLETLEDLSPEQHQELAEREKAERVKADKLDYWTEAWTWAWGRAGREAA